MDLGCDPAVRSLDVTLGGISRNVEDLVVGAVFHASTLPPSCLIGPNMVESAASRPSGRQGILFRAAAWLERAMPWCDRRPTIFAGQGRDWGNIIRGLTRQALVPSLPVTVQPSLAWFEAPKAGEGSQYGTNSDFGTARIDLCRGDFRPSHSVDRRGRLLHCLGGGSCVRESPTIGVATDGTGAGRGSSDRTA